MTDEPTPDDALDASLRSRLATLAPPAPLDLATLDQLEVAVRSGAARTRRRQRRRIGVAVGALAAAAAVLVAVVIWPGPSSKRVTTAPTVPSAALGAGRLLTASTDGRLEERSASNGRQLRTITEGIGANRSVTSLSTDAAGRYAYLSWTPINGVSDSTTHVVRVSLTDGATSSVGGVPPSDVVAISADGTRLAVAATRPRGGYDVSVLDLRSHRSSTWHGADPPLSSDLIMATALSWRPDGRNLAVSYDSLSTANGYPSPGFVTAEGADVIDTSHPPSRTNPRRVGTTATKSLSNATYLGRTGRMAVLDGCSTQDFCVTAPVLASLDPGTEHPQPLARSEPQLVGGDLIALTADPRGALYLLDPRVCAECQGGVGFGSGGGGTWRILHITDRQATTVTSGTISAYPSATDVGQADAPRFIAWVP